MAQCAGALLLDGRFEDRESCDGAEGGQWKVSGSEWRKAWLFEVVIPKTRLLTQMIYRLKGYCEQVGFWKEKEVSFPHKQSNLMTIRRDSWEQPAL